MKKLKMVMLSSFILLLFGGCVSNRISDEKAGEDLVNQVFECIKEEDVEGLKSLFSKNVTDSYDLDKEIEGLFEFVDGNVLSYEDSGLTSSSEEVEYGKQIYLAVSVKISNVKTDTEKVYDVSIFSIICEEDEEELGIASLKVRDEDKTIYSVGEP